MVARDSSPFAAYPRASGGTIPGTLPSSDSLQRILRAVTSIFPIILALMACGNVDRAQTVGADDSTAAPADLASGADSTDFGVVTVRDDTICLRSLRPVNAGRAIIIALPAPDTIVMATVGEAMPRCPDQVPAQGEYFAAVEASLPAGTIGIAVLAGDAVRMSPNTVDVDGDGSLETFRICASSEGLHLTAWAGKPLVGRRIWHYYYFLGYDVEPSCTPADYADH